MINSYSKIYNLGHRIVRDVFNGDVLLEEKIDGSQYSFLKKDGELYCRSHRRQLILDGPLDMFVEAVATVKSLQDVLHEGWIYRGEYLRKPKHNILSYDRIPEKHIILFDIDCGGTGYLSYEEKAAEAARIGLEVVPRFKVKIDSQDDFNELLETVSVLGGQKIEGVVIKNYGMYDPSGNVLMAKYVSERFKEIKKTNYNSDNPGNAGILQKIVNSLRTEARWEKAVIHLMEEGLLDDSPSDIGPLLKEINRDTKEECWEYCKEQLIGHFGKHILRGVSNGFPEWYKQRLLDKQFGVNDD